MGIECSKCHFDNPDDTAYCGKCATPLPSSKEILVTETLETPTEELTRGTIFASRYEIIEELGKGGMGKVYRVEDKKIKEEVALKLIKPEIASDKKTIERFSNELKMALKISHRNVCRMYDLGEEKGAHYITMEYVPGEDLKSFIRRAAPVSIGKSISIAKQVCEGMAEAHRLGVVHRDLKPQNIMVDEEGNARIMDFGIARSVKGKGITGAGVMIGTPEYMSPEQVEGKESDQRSDIYSLGVILYEMVTGRVPFEGETPLGIAMKHKAEMPKDPRELNDQIPVQFSQVILRCLEKEKQKRFHNAVEVGSELDKIEKGIPTPERVIPERKPITSKEITVSFGLKKLLIPALIIIFAVIALLISQFLPRKQASLAVLPFTDLSPQRDQEVLCDGMTEEIISKLSGLEGWKVISRTSAMRYKDTDKDIKEIGQELDVATILEGSVRKEKDDIRVTVELINVKDRSQLWSDTYQQKLERVFYIQSDVAEKIANALKSKLSPEEKEKIQKKPTDNLEAYNMYMKGRYFFHRHNAFKAFEYFEQAIEEDPNYASAYAGIADSYIKVGAVGLAGIAFPRAKEAVLKALEIDNSLSEAHVSLATIKYLYEWDWEGAEKEFKRAIELNPGYAVAHINYAVFLSAMARHDQAIQESRLSLELDPLSPDTNQSAGNIFASARQYDEAIEALQRAIEMDPNMPFSHVSLGIVYIHKSMYSEAIEEIQKEKEIIHAPTLDLIIGIVYAKSGKKDEAKKVLERLKDADVLNFIVAELYFVLGENDKGFEWLEKAYGAREAFMTGLKATPLIPDSVRSDPRFKALLKKMNLE